MTMIDWISTNSEELNLAANWLMVGIWLVYLQVFLRNFRRQTLPKIVINRAAGSSLDAACFVSNMSSEAIYIERVIVRIKAGECTLACTVTDFAIAEGEVENADPKQRTFQGTLSPGQYSSLGKFDDLIGMVAKRTGHNHEQLKSSGDMIAVEITIVADYASERLLVGATRTFDACWQGKYWKLTAASPGTHQIRSRRERRRLYNTVAEMD
ncbi:hypothetical protein ABGN05_14010 [Aquibium sp. LZ166]|uniref:SMODS-associating 2TM beta-strand rich effector domain-containing protein n=1 Tax=Aquibium pacificus TaxID=3153579 RepID=A0ABV3SJ30_9HYPH